MELIELNPQDQSNLKLFCEFQHPCAPELVLWGFQQRASYWMICLEDKILGRIGARISHHYPHTGYIGFFALDLTQKKYTEAALKLLNAAKNWLADQRVKDIFGPVDHTTWFNYRFSLPGKKDQPRHLWEPTTPKEYRDLFLTFGFEDFSYYHSVYFPYIKIGPWRIGEAPLKRAYHYFLNQGFSMRPFAMEKLESEILPIIYEISHEVFPESLLFEPIDYRTFSHLYSRALRQYDFGPSGFIISPQGEIAGFLFAFYDADYLVIKSIAIRKKYQGLNLSRGVIYSAIRQSFPLGKKATISALVKSGLASDSVNKRIQRSLPFTWKHEYVLMKMTL
jgi:hypothetical protein